MRVPLVAFPGVLCFLVGCHPHVQLRAPDVLATAEERVIAYNHLKPVLTREVDHIPGPGTSGFAYRTVEYIELQDGRKIYHPEDLQSVVSQQSITFRAAELYRDCLLYTSPSPRDRG